jgi:excinuclease ABC subunit C
LRHFGSAGAVSGANVDELKKVEGISSALAQTIYDHLHTVQD